MSRWLMEYQAWVEEIAQRLGLVKEQKKRPASAVAISPGRRFKRYRTHHPTPRTTSGLLRTLNRQTHGRFS